MNQRLRIQLEELPKERRVIRSRRIADVHAQSAVSPFAPSDTLFRRARRWVSEGNGAAGYGTFGEFRLHDGYRVTVEHSIYVAENTRGRGLGKALLAALIEEARRLDKRAMIGAIDATNELSLGLHRKFGFVEAGRLPGVGVKFGRPLDLVLMQKTL